MIISGIYGLVITWFCCLLLPKFRDIFMDFKVDLPLPTKLLLQIGDVISKPLCWIPVMAVSILWPLAALQFIPVPQQPGSRMAIRRALRTVIVVILVMTAIVLLLALMMPMIALIQSVSGPQKK